MISPQIAKAARKSMLFRHVDRNTQQRILKKFEIQRIEKGDFLFRSNEKSNFMYVVVEGKLRIEKTNLKSENAKLIKVATLRTGEIVGEVALLTNGRHSSQARATTDATILRIGKSKLQEVLRHHPLILENLTRIEAMRLRENNTREKTLQKELGFILHLYFTTPSDFAAAESGVTAALNIDKSKSCLVLKKQFLKKTSTANLRNIISARLLKFPSVYLSVNTALHEEKILTTLLHMADRLVVTFSEDRDSITKAAAFLSRKDAKYHAVYATTYTIAVHRPLRENLLRSEMEKILRLKLSFRLNLGNHYWETNDHRAVLIQCRTIARAITDSSQGVAFGGGGARALCEIGVLSELERHRIDFDHVAGTSMGALIAALYAQGLTSREISERFQKYLPTDKGLLSYNLPFVSFFKDRNVNRILRSLFGKMRFEDLPKPLTVIAADLISGKEVRIEKGLIWRAVRASMSLPVIFPPVKYKRYYLVDGGAVNNVPGNVLREKGVRNVLGVNSTPLADDTIKEYFASTNLLQLLRPGVKFWSNLRRVLKIIKLFFTRPPILQIANRAMMLEGSELIRQKADEFDLLLSPTVAHFGLFQFERREEIIDAGRKLAHEKSPEIKKLFKAL
ncbi:MAG TPA: patatin-like phospholipase family protein [Turneriella sp.]|nr:patatin-like phospholipase family protein [Turneriella sp.]